MIEVSKRARREIEKLKAQSPKAGFRLMIRGYGWAGPRLGLAQDEPKETDTTHLIDGILWIVSHEEEPHILGAGNIRVDYTESWFGSGFYVSKLGKASCNIPAST